MKHLFLFVFALISLDVFASTPALPKPKNKTVQRVQRKHHTANIVRKLTFRSTHSAFTNKRKR